MNTEQVTDHIGGALDAIFSGSALKDNPYLEPSKPPSKEVLRGRIRAALLKAREDGAYQELSEEEIMLLSDYRTWLRTADSATGVFHWRRRG